MRTTPKGTEIFAADAPIAAALRITSPAIVAGARFSAWLANPAPSIDPVTSTPRRAKYRRIRSNARSARLAAVLVFNRNSMATSFNGRFCKYHNTINRRSDSANAISDSSSNAPMEFSRSIAAASTEPASRPRGPLPRPSPLPRAVSCSCCRRRARNAVNAVCSRVTFTSHAAKTPSAGNRSRLQRHQQKDRLRHIIRQMCVAPAASAAP